MREKSIYLLFSDTGTYLSRAINYCTKQSLNHVSIGFDSELKEVYSFGRINPRNPFSGGFVKEDIRGDFLERANCKIYTMQITESDYNKILTNIKEIEAEASNYKYNFIGLIGVLLQIEINRKNALFCSQFVATVLKDCKELCLEKPHCFVTPADIREQLGLQLIYQGKLGDYPDQLIAESDIKSDETLVPKQSFLLLVSKKVKQYVFR
ncbi:hypothetical protein SAMN05216389_11376 [Oceanobacillus limi]|uniref:Permuted papain-like amidase enzyme, YaeF/YiiX, C92 family n=1 Tax=Oceanobacillus limi TaxID=930131 RepID=A0A1I0F377_9BACI|nr:hypothetical protein [Oceanobacillus limi]SET51843.1 hypothetical protein SAMN05216389_11376 [Oceanobacillus limi]